MKKISLILLLITTILGFSACGDELILESVSDLASLRVGAVGTTYGEIYANECGSENVIIYNTVEEASDALAANEVDCIITDLNTAKTVASARDDITTTETRIIDSIEFCAAVRTDDFDTLAVAEVVTSELEKETDFSKLCRGMIENTGKDREDFITDSQVGSSGIFTLGVIVNNSPYVFKASDGSIEGISVEYAKHFAAKRDQTLVIKTYESKTALSNALKAGEIDVYFREMPLPASPGISYTTTCYTAELRVLIADK